VYKSSSARPGPAKLSAARRGSGGADSVAFPTEGSADSAADALPRARKPLFLLHTDTS
jgi:hypothetical protein